MPSELPWDKFKRQVTFLGTPTIAYTEEDCQRVAQRIGIDKLPPSYVQYVIRFGSGEWKPDLAIFVPHHLIKTATLEFNWKSWSGPINGQPKSEELLQLIPFGGHGDGYELCWDTKRKNGDEMAICLYEPEWGKAVDCGGNLLEFLAEYWIGHKLDVAYPFSNGGSWGGKPEFRVFNG